ncbi:hypothetical protein [Methanosarcina horonobensis]|nr:hypothetical protein [Methanosarcina horonobensis]
MGFAYGYYTVVGMNKKRILSENKNRRRFFLKNEKKEILEI